MKKKVCSSSFSWVLTAVLLAGTIAGCVYMRHEPWGLYVLLAILVILIASTLFYAPLAIAADDENVTVVSAVKRHRIPLRDIASVKLFQPTMGAVRVCGSGGFMGYWGLFREGDIGRYFAYYGKASDCFLVVLRNGRKYVLGCEEPAEMVSYIAARINA